MNITNEKEVMIFRREYNDKTFYSVGLSKKLQDGTYENGSIGCQFKKGIEIQDKSKILIKSAWLSFYKDKEKKTVPYIFINEYKLTAETIKTKKQDIDKEYVDFGNSVELTDDDIDNELAF